MAMAAVEASPIQASFTLKVTFTLAPSRETAVDLADLDPGDPHLVAVAQPGGLGEVGAVGRAAADERQRVGVVRGQADQGQDQQPHQADRDGVALLHGLEA